MAQQEYDFSQGSIAKNIMSLAVPMTAAQLINVLYSVVDRMYLGRLPGHLALTGLGLTIPIVSIIMGFANLCGTGGAPLCSICRGRGDQEEAERVMGNAFTLLLIFGGAVTALFLIFKRPILYLFGASDATYPYADAYMTVYLLGTVFVMIGLGMNPFINAQGFGRVGMMTVGLGAVVNIVLDPIFIFWLDLGVQGAAWATVIAQGCSAVWVLVFLTGRKAALRLRPRYMVLKPARVRKIVSLGLSGFFMNLTNSLVQVVCNATLQVYGGDLYVGVMTIINSLREVFMMPIHGLSNGAQPVTGYNYGAGLYSRVRQSIGGDGGLRRPVLGGGHGVPGGADPDLQWGRGDAGSRCPGHADLLLSVHSHVAPDGGAGGVRQPGPLPAGDLLLSAAQGGDQRPPDGSASGLAGDGRGVRGGGGVPAGGGAGLYHHHVLDGIPPLRPSAGPGGGMQRGQRGQLRSCPLLL